MCQNFKELRAAFKPDDLWDIAIGFCLSGGTFFAGMALRGIL